MNGKVEKCTFHLNCFVHRQQILILIRQTHLKYLERCRAHLLAGPGHSVAGGFLVVAELLDGHRHVAVVAHRKEAGMVAAIVLDQRGAIVEFHFARRVRARVHVRHAPLGRLTELTVAQHDYVIVVVAAVRVVTFVAVAALHKRTFVGEFQ